MSAAGRVRVVESGIADANAQLDAAKLEAQAAEAALVDLDDMRAGAIVGELTEREVEEHAATHEQVRDKAKAKIKQLRGTLVALDRKLAEARQEVLDEDLEAVTVELAEASKVAAALGGQALTGVLEAAAKQAVKLLDARARVAELVQEHARAQRLAGRNVDAAEYLTDEVGWLPPQWERLLGLLQSGPSTPVADAEAKRRRLQEQHDRERSNLDGRLLRELATETLDAVRLRADEPLDEVIDRVLEERGLPDRRADVVAMRERLIREHLAEVERTYEHTEASWREQDWEPPPRELDEYEIAWRRANEIPVDDRLLSADDDEASDLATTGTVPMTAHQRGAN